MSASTYTGDETQGITTAAPIPDDATAIQAADVNPALETILDALASIKAGKYEPRYRWREVDPTNPQTLGLSQAADTYNLEVTATAPVIVLTEAGVAEGARRAFRYFDQAAAVGDTYRIRRESGGASNIAVVAGPDAFFELELVGGIWIGRFATGDVTKDTDWVP
jgi:hypothetical protein